jgi:hypothetical protein
MRQRPMPRRSTGSRRPTPVPAANPARGGRGGPRGVTPPKVAPQMQRGGRGGSAMPARQAGGRGGINAANARQAGGRGGSAMPARQADGSGGINAANARQAGGRGGSAMPAQRPQVGQVGQVGRATPAGRATPQIQQKAQQESLLSGLAQAGGINRGSRQQATQTRGGMGTSAKRPQATQTSGRMGTPAPQGGQQARPMPQMQRRKSGGAVKKK